MNSFVKAERRNNMKTKILIIVVIAVIAMIHIVAQLGILSILEYWYEFAHNVLN